MPPKYVCNAVTSGLHIRALMKVLSTIFECGPILSPRGWHSCAQTCSHDNCASCTLHYHGRASTPAASRAAILEERAILHLAHFWVYVTHATDSRTTWSRPQSSFSFITCVVHTSTVSCAIKSSTMMSDRCRLPVDMSISHVRNFKINRPCRAVQHRDGPWSFHADPEGRNHFAWRRLCHDAADPTFVQRHCQPQVDQACKQRECLRDHKVSFGCDADRCQRRENKLVGISELVLWCWSGSGSAQLCTYAKSATKRCTGVCVAALIGCAVTTRCK